VRPWNFREIDATFHSGLNQKKKFLQKKEFGKNSKKNSLEIPSKKEFFGKKSIFWGGNFGILEFWNFFESKEKFRKNFAEIPRKKFQKRIFRKKFQIFNFN
jgi:hypothetical protein